MTPPKKPGAGNGSDMLSGLPRTRPQRPSARRDAARAASAAAAAAPTPKAAPAPSGTAAPRRKSDVPAAGYATPKPDEQGVVGSPTELVATAIQAAGELAQIGATLGGQALRSALARLPRP